MNRIMKQQFAVLFAFLLVFANLSFIQPQAINAATIDSAVTITAIDDEGKEVIETAAVAFEEGDTAEDVLVKVAEEQNVELILSDSEYGTSLDGIGEHEVPEDFSIFWSFNINGQEADVGISGYEVTHGDNILFLFTAFPADEVAATVTVIDGNGDSIVDTGIELVQSATAYDALVQATKEEDVSLDVSIDEEYFTFINNLADYNLTEGDYWEFIINEESATVGVLGHVVEPEDHFEFTIGNFDETEEDSDEQNSENMEDNSDEPDKKLSAKELNSLVNSEIDAIISRYFEETPKPIYGAEWWVWAIANHGEEIPESYKKDITRLLEQDIDKLSKATDLERVIIALAAIGEEVTSFNDHNLIELLEDNQEIEEMINAAIFALIAFNSGDYDVNENMEDAVIDYILESEITNGGWDFGGGEVASSDLTGMALIGLSAYQERPEVEESIQRAVDILSEAQQENGGYKEFDNYSAESVAQVVIGLLSVGIDPTSESFTKDGGNLVEYLLSFKVEDGLYCSNEEVDELCSTITTPQVLLALSYYDNYIQSDADTEEDSDSKSATYLIWIGLIGLLIFGFIVFVLMRKSNKK